MCDQLRITNYELRGQILRIERGCRDAMLCVSDITQGFKYVKFHIYIVDNQTFGINSKKITQKY